MRDGRSWRIGCDCDVAWIRNGTDEGGVKVTCAIPPIFEAYWTVELPDSGEHDWAAEEVERFAPAFVDVLATHTPAQPWWLGFLERSGESELIFDDAPRVSLYNGGYVLVEAGATQAATWRGRNWWSRERQPDLMFPRDQIWLASNLWDDDWVYLGGPRFLQRAFLAHPHLKAFARAVRVDDEDATPPGHIAM